MTLEELARTTPQEQPAPIQQRQEVIKPAPQELKHKIAQGCRLQILKDIQGRQNPYRMLLTAAEAISRLDNDADTFFLQVRDKLIEVYGRDVSIDN